MESRCRYQRSCVRILETLHRIDKTEKHPLPRGVSTNAGRRGAQRQSW